MTDPKSEVAAAIEKAQNALAQAASELHQLPALDARSIGLAAHALNNFLTVSGFVVELLLRSLRDQPTPEDEARADLQRGLEALGHATNLMTHTVSRLMNQSAGRGPRLKLDDVALPTLAQRACAYYRPSADQKGLELTFSAAGDVPVIQTDRVVVAAVLDNLLSNAVKYSVRGKRIWVSVAGERGGVVCRVRDEGPGLSPEEQTRLFQAGARVGPTPTAGEPSTGYGLALAKQFVETLGGEITCTSAKGEGATFAFWLPRRFTAPAA